MKEITLHNINKSFGEHQVIKDFTYTFNEKKMIAIVGESGSGKSTLMNILGLLEKPTSGEILYGDYGAVSIHSKKATKLLRSEIAYLFQNYALADNETVYKNIAIAMEYTKIKDKKKAAVDTLNSVGLHASYLDKKIFTLSGGEQQRVALARVICKPSSLILADEPTGNLDEKNANEVFHILQDMCTQGKCVVIVTHDPLIAKRCHEIIKL